MGLLKTAGRAAVASSVHGRVQRRQHQRWAAQAQAQAPVAQPVVVAPVAAPPPPPPATDMAEQMELLRQLGELRDSGILSDEEFEAKKSKILAG